MSQILLNSFKEKILPATTFLLAVAAVVQIIVTRARLVIRARAGLLKKIIYLLLEKRENLHGSASRDQLNDHDHRREHQKQVNYTAGDVAEKTEQPQNQ